MKELKIQLKNDNKTSHSKFNSIFKGKAIKKMSKGEIEKGEAELKNKKLKKEKSIDGAKTEIVIAFVIN